MPNQVTIDYATAKTLHAIASYEAKTKAERRAVNQLRDAIRAADAAPPAAQPQAGE